jgi:hypothetical protein
MLWKIPFVTMPYLFYPMSKGTLEEATEMAEVFIGFFPDWYDSVVLNAGSSWHVYMTTMRTLARRLLGVLIGD